MWFGLKLKNVLAVATDMITTDNNCTCWFNNSFNLMVHYQFSVQMLAYLLEK